MFGNVGYSGFILNGGGVTPPPGGGGYEQVVGVAGDGGTNPIAGENTWTVEALIGATNLNFTIVNNLPEMIGTDFTFNSETGTITRPGNVWQVGDKIIVPFTPAS
jgi:hypothetical protein